MGRHVYEIFENLTSAKNPTDEKLEDALRAYSFDPVMKGLLNLNFNPNFEGFDLNPGVPLYYINKAIPTGQGGATNIYCEFRRFYIFFNSFKDINREGKNTRFIQLLEGLHWKEAEIMVAIKDRKLQELFPDINETLIRTVFPDILPPIAEGDGILAALYGCRNADMNNLRFKVFSKEEIARLAKVRKVIFKFPEEAIAKGFAHLLPDYVAPPKYYDPELYIEFKVKKLVFGNPMNTTYHRLYSELGTESSIAEFGELSKHGAELTFTDVVKAAEYDLFKYDFRSKIVTTPKKKQKPGRKAAPKPPKPPSTPKVKGKRGRKPGVPNKPKVIVETVAEVVINDEWRKNRKESCI